MRIRRFVMRGLLRYQQTVIKKSLRFERWNVVLHGHEMLVCGECFCLMDLSRAAPFHFLSFSLSPLISCAFFMYRNSVDSYNSWPQRALNYTALIGLENIRENLVICVLREF